MVRLLVRYRWFALVLVLALAVDLVTKSVVFDRLGLADEDVHEVIEQGWERYREQKQAIEEFERHVAEAEEAGVPATMAPPSTAASLYFTFPENHRHEIVEDYLYFSAVLNPGAFGGMLGGQTLALLVLSGVAVLIVGWILFRADWPRYQITGGLIIGGAFGNIYDRVVFGAVRDFVDFRLPEAGVSWLNPWNTFNFADAVIVGGILALLVIELFFPLEDPKKKKKEKEKAKQQQDKATPAEDVGAGAPDMHEPAAGEAAP